MAIKEIELTEFDYSDIDVIRDIIFDHIKGEDYETEDFGFKIVVFINDGEDT
jgi:hypothetical protein